MAWRVRGLGVGVGVTWHDIAGHERADTILLTSAWVDSGSDVVEVVDGSDDPLVPDTATFRSLTYE